MTCKEVSLLIGTVLLFLWLLNAAVFGIGFRLRLWWNRICFYHGPKKPRIGMHGVWYQCAGCDEHHKNNKQAKLDRLEARRKRVIGR